MKYEYKGTDSVIEAEQFQSLGYHEKDGLIARGLVKGALCQDTNCSICGERYIEHLYLQYGEIKLTLCRGDYVVYDPTVDSYFSISEEDFERRATPLKGQGAVSSDMPKNDPFTHPLKNPDASHYAMWHGTDGEAIEAIDLMEKMFTKEELLIWAKITVLKYRLRIGKKDDIAKEMKKVDTYEAYIAYLEHKIRIERMPKYTPEGMASMRRYLDAEFEKYRAFFKANEAKN